MTAVVDAERSEVSGIISMMMYNIIIHHHHHRALARGGGSEWAEGEGAANDDVGGSEFERSEDELWLYR